MKPLKLVKFRFFRLDQPHLVQCLQKWKVMTCLRFI